MIILMRYMIYYDSWWLFVRHKKCKMQILFLELFIIILGKVQDGYQEAVRELC